MLLLLLLLPLLTRQDGQPLLRPPRPRCTAAWSAGPPSLGATPGAPGIEAATGGWIYRSNVYVNIYIYIYVDIVIICVYIYRYRVFICHLTGAIPKYLGDDCHWVSFVRSSILYWARCWRQALIIVFSILTMNKSFHTVRSACIPWSTLVEAHIWSFFLITWVIFNQLNQLSISNDSLGTLGTPSLVTSQCHRYLLEHSDEILDRDTRREHHRKHQLREDTKKRSWGWIQLLIPINIYQSNPINKFQQI